MGEKIIYCREGRKSNFSSEKNEYEEWIKDSFYQKLIDVWENIEYGWKDLENNDFFAEVSRFSVLFMNHFYKFE